MTDSKSLIEFDNPEAAKRAAWMLRGEWLNHTQVAMPDHNSDPQTIDAVASVVGSEWQWVGTAPDHGITRGHSITYGRTSSGMSRLPELSAESVSSILDNQSQNICIIGRSALLKTSLCKLFVEQALSNQRTVHVISGGMDEYNTYQDQINLKHYHEPMMMIGEDYDLYLDNFVYPLLQAIEPAENSLIVVDEVDPWRKRLDIVEDLLKNAQSARAQVICVSQNYRLEPEFLKHLPVLIIPKTLRMQQRNWAHEFFSRMDQISSIAEEVQVFNFPSAIFQIRHLRTSQA